MASAAAGFHSIFKWPHFGSYVCYRRRNGWTIFAYRRETGWRPSVAAVPGNTAFASTTNGGFASVGPKEARPMSKSSTIIAERLHNPHPGEILAMDFMAPMGLSQNALARAVHVSPRRINEIVNGQRGITADTDLRLARYFGVSEGFFLALQAEYDLLECKRQIGTTLESIRPRAA